MYTHSWVTLLCSRNQDNIVNNYLPINKKKRVVRTDILALFLTLGAKHQSFTINITLLLLSHFSRVQFVMIPLTVAHLGILEWVAISFSRESNLHLLCLLHYRHILYPLNHQGSPNKMLPIAILQILFIKLRKPPSF